MAATDKLGAQFGSQDEDESGEPYDALVDARRERGLPPSRGKKPSWSASWDYD